MLDRAFGMTSNCRETMVIGKLLPDRKDTEKDSAFSGGRTSRQPRSGSGRTNT